MKGSECKGIGVHDQREKCVFVCDGVCVSVVYSCERAGPMVGHRSVICSEQRVV